MKIALALSGLPRLYAISAASWGRILGKYNIDTFIHTWSQSYEIDQLALHQLTWCFNPKQIQLDIPVEIDISKYPNRHWPCIDVYKSLSMWHSIKRAHAMILESGIQYDIVIRGRLDWFVRDLEIINHHGVVIPFDADKHVLQFIYMGQQVYGYNDHFAYGSIEQMTKYVHTLDLIYQLYSNEEVDYCPENFLTASLIKQEVPVLLQKMEHKLIRG